MSGLEATRLLRDESAEQQVAQALQLPLAGGSSQGVSRDTEGVGNSVLIKHAAESTAPGDPCKRCPHPYRVHATTTEGYQCRACKCQRRFWR